MKDPQVVVIVKNMMEVLKPVARICLWRDGTGTIEIDPKFWDKEQGDLDQVEMRITAIADCLRRQKELHGTPSR